MQNTTDILEGLHVLLVSEDEQRTQVLGKALRERRAHVGNLKSSSRDPIALRGADVLVIDTRTAQNTQQRVNEMRADVRARWASVINLDFAKVVPDGAPLQFILLENAVAPITASDRALTERARREPSFSTELLPLGPTRILRALGMAGTTLQVEFNSGSDSKASLTLSNELLVSAFMERDGTRWEAWKALARVLGLSDATVKVSRLQHPSAMNIMEPLDQALQTAAQERAAAAAELAKEEPSTKKPEPPAAEPAKAASPVASLSAATKDLRVQPGRTIMGIAPAIPRPAPPAAPPPAPAQVAAPPPAPMASVASAKPVPPPPQAPARAVGGSELGKPGRTIMGIAPGVLPALGAFGVRTPAKPEPQPEPAPAPMELASTPAHVSLPARPAASEFGSRTEPPASTNSHVGPISDAALVSELALQAPDNSQERELMPTMPAPAPSEAVLHFNEAGGSRVERIERVSLGDTPTDPAPARPSRPEEPLEFEGDSDEDTAIVKSEQIDRLREEAARLSAANLPATGSTLGEDFAGFIAESRDATATQPFDSSALARASEPIKTSVTGPINFSRDESQEETITMERPEVTTKRSGNLVALSLVGLLALAGGGYLLASRTQVTTADEAAPTVPAAAQAQAAAPQAAAPIEAPVAAKAAVAPEAPAPAAPAPSEPAAAAPAPTPSEPAAAAAPAAPVAAAPAAPTAAAPEPAVPAPSGEAAAPAGAAGATDAEALEALIKDGTRLLAEKNPTMAKPLFEAALARDPKNPHAQAGLGQALLETGEPALAQAAFEAAVKLRPKRSRYRVQLGDALKAQGKVEEARAAWQKALEVDPNDRDAPKRLGN